MTEKNYFDQINELVQQNLTTEQIYQYLDIPLSDFIEILSYIKAEALLEQYLDKEDYNSEGIDFV